MKRAPLSNVLPVKKNTCGVNIDPPSILFWFIIFSLKGIALAGFFLCGIFPLRDSPLRDFFLLRINVSSSSLPQGNGRDLNPAIA